MNLQQAKMLCENEMERHGLFEKGWNFTWITSNGYHGRCFHKEKLIALSHRMTSVNTEEVVTDTIRHEIAHALAGPKHSHDDVWRAKAVELGATPRATCRNGNRVKMAGNVVMAA